MPGPITCTSSPTPFVCADPEPTSTPTAGPPPDPSAARRAAQADADERMASFVGDGGMSDTRGAAREGQVPLATTTRSLTQAKADWEEHKKGIAGRDKPVQFDPFTQAVVSAGVGSVVGAITTSLATVAEEFLTHTLAHAAYDVAEHQLHELGHENTERTRERANGPARSTPKPRPTPTTCTGPLQSSAMYLGRIPG